MFRSSNKLGKSAKAHRGQVPEHLITGLKLLYVAAYRFNLPGNIGAENIEFWR